ncbi:MAG: phage holin family protein [Streptosporangiales bacterium]|nr:phage holin family protein [Streptosporangiales bacterium]
MRLLAKIVITALALWAATLLPGISAGAGSGAERAVTLVVVACVFGVINAVLKPIIETVGCLFYVLTLGLFTFVVNAALLLLTAWITGKLGFGFQVDGFWWAVAGSIVVSIVSYLLHLALPGPRRDAEPGD